MHVHTLDLKCLVCCSTGLEKGLYGKSFTMLVFLHSGLKEVINKYCKE